MPLTASRPETVTWILDIGAKDAWGVFKPIGLRSEEEVVREREESIIVLAVTYIVVYTYIKQTLAIRQDEIS